MKNSTFSRFTSVLLACVLAFAMIFACAAESHAAGSFEKLRVGSTTYNAGSVKPVVYVGQTSSLGIYGTGSKSLKITKVTSADKTIVKVTSLKLSGGGKQFSLKGVKKGKAAVTLTFKDADGVKQSTSFTVTVKSYPKPISKLTVNGKTVKVSKYKYSYSGKLSGTSVKVKMALKTNWKISDAYGYGYTGSKSVQLDKNIDKSKFIKKIQKGTKISVAKKYKSAYFTITMRNTKNGQSMTYNIYLSR